MPCLDTTMDWKESFIINRDKNAFYPAIPSSFLRKSTFFPSLSLLSHLPLPTYFFFIEWLVEQEPKSSSPACSIKSTSSHHNCTQCLLFVRASCNLQITHEEPCDAYRFLIEKAVIIIINVCMFFEPQKVKMDLAIQSRLLFTLKYRRREGGGRKILLTLFYVHFRNYSKIPS